MKFHTIMNMYYVDYNNPEVKEEKLNPPYLVVCDNYADGDDLCLKLKDLGFECVYNLPIGYRILLVNLDAKRYGGIPAPANFNNCGKYTKEEFIERILNPYISDCYNNPSPNI